MATILVVDDDFMTLKTMERVLSGWGHRVVVKKDGEDALAHLCEDNDIDLVITDVMMPHLDGAQLVTQMHELESRRSTPALVMSSTVSMTQDDVDKLGAYGFLLKPVAAKALVNTVANCLNLEPPSSGPISGPISKPLSRRWGT